MARTGSTRSRRARRRSYGAGTVLLLIALAATGTVTAGWLLARFAVTIPYAPDRATTPEPARRFGPRRSGGGLSETARRTSEAVEVDAYRPVTAP